MSLRSAFDPSFLAQVEQWIVATGEVFVVIRYAYRAGLRDYLFINSIERFRAILDMLPPLADIIVFRSTQLPVRGLTDRHLLARALNATPNGEWWMLLSKKEGYDIDQLDAFYADSGNSHEELERAFKEFEGTEVAVGLEPPYSEADNTDMQSGLVPMPDGTLRAGVY